MGSFRFVMKHLVIAWMQQWEKMQTTSQSPLIHAMIRVEIRSPMEWINKGKGGITVDGHEHCPWFSVTTVSSCMWGMVVHVNRLLTYLFSWSSSNAYLLGVVECSPFLLSLTVISDLWSTLSYIGLFIIFSWSIFWCSLSIFSIE